MYEGENLNSLFKDLADLGIIKDRVILNVFGRNPGEGLTKHYYVVKFPTLDKEETIEASDLYSSIKLDTTKLESMYHMKFDVLLLTNLFMSIDTKLDLSEYAFKLANNFTVPIRIQIIIDGVVRADENNRLPL